MSSKCCIVPQCTNTNKKNPKKVFVSVPINPKRRKKWLELARRNPNSVSANSSIFMCEDHFNMEKDTINYMKFKMGFSKKILLTDDAVPLKFHCQKRIITNLGTSQELKYKIEGPTYLNTKQEDDGTSSGHDNSVNITYVFSDDSTLSTNSQFMQEDDVDPIGTISEQVNPLRIVHVFSEVEFTARGLVPPVFTPLHSDGSINYSAVSSYAQYLADAGIKAVLVGGTTGENMSMKVVDRMKLIDEWVAASESTGLHIMVQIGGAPLADVLLLAKYCANTGVHSLLTLPELYFKPQSVDELVSYVQLVAEAAPSLPILYYHIPSMSKVEINMPQFVSAATARIPNFKGLKFTSNDLSEAAQVLRSLQEGQEIFLGADTLLAPAALLGIKSSIGTTFNLFPALAQQILQAVDNNDVVGARNLQEKLSLAIEAHTCEGAWVPIMKAGMEIVTGINVGPPALPQRPISAEARARIANRLTELGVADLKWQTS